MDPIDGDDPLYDPPAGAPPYVGIPSSTRCRTDNCPGKPLRSCWFASRTTSKVSPVCDATVRGVSANMVSMSSAGARLEMLKFSKVRTCSPSMKTI